MMDSSKTNINPKHNKLRLVYATDSKGSVVSYIHVEKSEARRILAVLRYMNGKKDKIKVEALAKATKQNYYSLMRTLNRMAAALWADMKKDGKYVKLHNGRLIYMRKSMMNKKRNLNRRLQYLKPTIYILNPCTCT